MHGFPNREVQEREERMGNSLKPKETSGEATTARNSGLNRTTAMALGLGGCELDARVESCYEAK